MGSLRMPPQDLGAEQALLGSLMLKPEGLYEIVDAVRAEDCYAEKHRKIFRAMLALQEKGEPIDLVSLTTTLKSSKQLEQIGGAAYLTELINLVPSAGNLKYYAEVVGRKSALRKLIYSADNISELGYNEQDDLDSIFERAEKVILNIGHFSKKTFVALKDTLVDAWERFDHLHKSDGQLRGVPTGFKDLDHKLAGLQKSDLIILAARPSMGKTSLALDIARNVACGAKKSVGIFSLEMSCQQLVDRLIAAESRVDAWKLRTGKLRADDEFSKIRDALDRLSAAPLWIDDEPSNNITKMKAVARRLKAEHGLDLIIVDYLQLMVPKKDGDSLVQQVTEISRSLKALARELEVPVLALSQLNRAVETRGGKPRLSDLRDSGSIEQDADVVLFIHRDDKYNEQSDKTNIADIIIAKHRNGPVGEVQLYFDEARVSFTGIEKHDFGQF
ncbi:MAG: replicative DNA helicase [Candidatus Vogelbacteria bacterium]|nr:replicative DNA helicase [Candidatus Vogelbacteria bacterium]